MKESHFLLSLCKKYLPIEKWVIPICKDENALECQVEIKVSSL